jgi:NADPH-dependent curcumin reductase CurA
MATASNRLGPNMAVRVAGAPEGLPELSDFEVAELPIPEPGEGEVLFRSIYMGLEPSMRRRMPSPVNAPTPIGGAAKIGELMSAGQIPPGDPLFAGHVGEVIASRHPDFAPGDFVKGGTWWQVYHAVPGRLLRKLDPKEAPLRAEMGVLGQSPFVAWCGMELIAKAKPGETVVVSAASGAVGMAAGQLAKIAGARAVGIASGEKCRYVVDELGFDACIDRTAGPIGPALDRVCPDGIDVYFDNTGGEIMRAAFDRLNDFGRLVVCGAVAEYNAPEGETGPPLRPVLRKRIRIEGFVVWDHVGLYPPYRRQMLAWMAEGRMRYRDHLVDGLANGPAGLIGLLRGENRGKMIVQVGEDPTAAGRPAEFPA